MKKFYTLLTGLILVLFPLAARSATISIMKDGSGDYTLLQPAADAAAPGDTLLIGPGRYEEVTDFAYQAGLEVAAHLVIRVDDLTILGLDRDTVVLGPSVPLTSRTDPVGIVVAENVSVTHVENLSFENEYLGAYAMGDFNLENCVIRSCGSGLFTFGATTIMDCVIRDNVQIGIIMGSGERGWVGRCQILDNGTDGISVNYCDDLQVWDTHIRGGWVGMLINNSVGSIRGCLVEDMRSGIGVGGGFGTAMTITDNTMRNNRYSLTIDEEAVVDAHDNRLLDFTEMGVFVVGPCTIHINHNNILSSQGYLAYLIRGLNTPVHYDLTNNYWGTTDSDVLSQRIYDYYDTDESRIIAVYEPFAGITVPAEGTSFGKLKAQFLRN